MRFSTQSTETVDERPAAGRRFKIPWRGQRHQGGVDNRSTTDGVSRDNQKRRGDEPRAECLTFEQRLNAQQYCEASQLLREREEFLFGEIKETAALKDHEEEKAKLSQDYRKLEAHVQQALKLSLTLEEDNMQALTSAVRAINQEMEQDKRWSLRAEEKPNWRPSNWSSLHDKTLGTLVEERINNPSTPTTTPVKQSCIQEEVHSIGRQLKQDLLLVVERVKPCYPPEMDICNFYAGLYHKGFSARFRKIAQSGLDDCDSIFILRWVNEFYPEMLKKPELAGEINTESFKKLLPQESLEPLEEQYLSKQKDELTTCVGRVLEQAKEKWREGREPAREDGCYVSTVAYDIIQCIHAMVTAAEKTVGDKHKAQRLTCELKDFILGFNSYQNDIIKQNKPNSSAFIKANLHCVEQFSDVLHKQKDLFPEEVRTHFLTVLSDMEKSAHAYLLKPVHEALKPQYRKLGTADWLKQLVSEKLLVSIEQQLPVLQGSTKSCHQKLIGQLHQEVTAEYVKRLLKGEVKLKDKALQVKAYETMKDDAEGLHNLFTSRGSGEVWLTDILHNIAEVLKLQDLSAIQLQVASLGTASPDISVKHISALLKLKTNLSRADRKKVKDTLPEILAENVCDGARVFFSTFEVK